MCAYNELRSAGKSVICPCPLPKKVLTSSSWISRNDSTSINAILHPDCYISSHRLRYGEKTKGDVIEKHILSRNNCYCCENTTSQKPLLFKRPNSCVSYEILKNLPKKQETNLKRRSLLCVCEKNDLVTDAPKGLKLKDKDETIDRANQTEADIQFTTHREKYEQYRERKDEEFEHEVKKYEEKRKHEYIVQDSDDVATILGTQKYDSETSQSNYGNVTSTNALKYGSRSSRDSRPDLPKYHAYSVPEFRKEYYFETHDSGKVVDSESQTDHTCVHQFRLNDRFLPNALNKDIYGRSRCKICDKPMEGSALNLSTSYVFDEERPSKSKIKNFAIAYKNGMVPRNVNLNKGKSKIEIFLKESDLNKLNTFVKRAQKPVYGNSLALRHQKIRII